MQFPTQQSFPYCKSRRCTQKKKHLILRTSWETAFMSKGKSTRRSIDLPCVWLALMHAELTYSWSNVILFVWMYMFARFIIRVCLACGRPQHAVGFHYVVIHTSSSFCYCIGLGEGNSYFSFPSGCGEGRGWSTLTSQDFVISTI